MTETHVAAVTFTSALIHCSFHYIVCHTVFTSTLTMTGILTQFVYCGSERETPTNAYATSINHININNRPSLIHTNCVFLVNPVVFFLC